jgi:diacylglycerol kinase family enzyme
MALIIFNPGSRGGQSSRWKERIIDFYSRNLPGTEFRETSCLDDAKDFSREACLRSEDTIIAVGGDGTINRVINGMYDSEGRRLSKTALAVLYTGTSPDFCKNFGLPYRNVKKAMEYSLSRQSVEIPMMLLEYRSKEGDIQRSVFSCASNIGIGSAVAEYANSGIRKILGDFLGTFISLLKAFFSSVPRDLVCLLDDKEMLLQSATSLTLGRSRYVASGIQVNPPKTLNTDELYLLGIEKVKFTSIPGLLYTLYSGIPIKEGRHIRFGSGRRIQIQSKQGKTAVEFDGDPAGYLPCSCSITPDPLTLVGGGMND